MQNPRIFEFESYGVKLSVEELELPGRVGFRVIFGSRRKPIVIVRATDKNNEKFWTTVPENKARQKEAEGVGKLIEEYIKSQL